MTITVILQVLIVFGIVKVSMAIGRNNANAAAADEMSTITTEYIKKLARAGYIRYDMKDGVMILRKLNEGLDSDGSQKD